jgi:hypothetical protein
MKIQDMEPSDIETMRSGLLAVCQALDDYGEFKAAWDGNRSQLETLAQAASSALAAYTTALDGRQLDDSIRQTLESAARDRRSDLEQSRRALEAQSAQLDRLLSVPLSEIGRVQPLVLCPRDTGYGAGLVTQDAPGPRTDPVGEEMALGFLDPGDQGPRALTQGQRVPQSESVEEDRPPETVTVPEPPLPKIEEPPAVEALYRTVQHGAGAGNGDGLAFEDLFKEEAPGDGPPATDAETEALVAEIAAMGSDEEGLWASLFGQGTDGGPFG